jgi:hypothetical protein
MFLELVEVLCEPMYISDLNPRGSEGAIPETLQSPPGPAVVLSNCSIQSFY